MKTARLEQLAQLETELHNSYYTSLPWRKLRVLIESPLEGQPGKMLGTACRYVPVGIRHDRPAETVPNGNCGSGRSGPNSSSWIRVMIDRGTPKRPRWLRFSLRTFVLAITGLCIWLGVLAAGPIAACGRRGHWPCCWRHSRIRLRKRREACRRDLSGFGSFSATILCSPTNATLVGENITDDFIENTCSTVSSANSSHR